MAFCRHCGTEFKNDSKFCVSCGKAADFEYPLPPDTGYEAEGRGMAALAYMSWLFLIPLLTGAHKTSPFVRYHLNQGAVLFISLMIYTPVIVFTALITFFLMISTKSPFPIIILGFEFSMIPLFTIIGIINALRGQCKPLPIIGKFKIIK